MFNFNKYLAAFAILFSASAVHAATVNYTVENNATQGIYVDFYYYVNNLTSESEKVAAAQTKVLTTQNIANFISVRPQGLFSGAAIRFSIAKVQQNKFTVTSSKSGKNLYMYVYSNGKKIASGTFVGSSIPGY